MKRRTKQLNAAGRDDGKHMTARQGEVHWGDDPIEVFYVFFHNKKTHKQSQHKKVKQ